jgi:hypothetical protein
MPAAFTRGDVKSIPLSILIAVLLLLRGGVWFEPQDAEALRVLVDRFSAGALLGQCPFAFTRPSGVGTLPFFDISSSWIASA